MSRQRRLGKGIDALLQGRDLTSLENDDLASVVNVPIDRLRPNPDQPRKSFSSESLEELARSIEERGIIQPILAEHQDDDTYLIIAGERRYRAAEIAGLTVVPVLPGVFSEEEKIEIALIENIQRRNLTPMEEARAYRELMDRAGLNQEELARRLGKSRPAVANSVRLLALPEEVRGLVDEGTLSAGHARTLLGLDDAELVVETARMVGTHDLSVRAVEALVAAVNAGSPPADALAETARPERPSPTGGTTERSGGTTVRSASAPEQPTRKTVEMERIEQQLIERLGTRVVVSGSNTRGKIEISYLSMEDLERIVEVIDPDGETGG